MPMHEPLGGRRPVGGLGWYLIRQLADCAGHRRGAAGGNLLMPYSAARHAEIIPLMPDCVRAVRLGGMHLGEFGEVTGAQPRYLRPLLPAHASREACR